MQTYLEQTEELNRTIANFRAALELCGDDELGRAELRQQIREFKQELLDKHMEHRSGSSLLVGLTQSELNSIAPQLDERATYAKAILKGLDALSAMLSP